jgi:transposase
MEADLAKKYSRFCMELNERQQRLWAANEAMSLGYGGVSIVSRATGISRPTIIKGIRELNNNEHLPLHRVRRSGGGRKKRHDQNPHLKPALEAIVEPSAKGDPMSPLRWTTHGTRQHSFELTQQGFSVSHTLVRQLLREMDYHLSANRKSCEGGQNSDRPIQFEYINKQVTLFQDNGSPVISVDAKKRELIGNFKQNGRVWRPKGEPE